MGYSLSWLALKGTNTDAGLESIGLSRTGRVGEWGCPSVIGQKLPDGWYLILAPDCDHPVVSDANLAVLSSDTEVIACRLEEHVMFSCAELWERGKKVWYMEHDAQQVRRHLKIDGRLPAAYDIFLSQAEELRDADDRGPREVDFYFEVPLETAKAIAGFKHDEDNAAIDYKSFEVFSYSSKSAVEKTARKWWQIWK
jgi:hypothetical protein